MNNVQSSLSPIICRAAMKAIAAQARSGYLENISVSQKDFEDVTAGVPWVSADRNRLTAALHSMLTSTTDMQGFERFRLPVEWISSAIAVFVHPVNWMLACRYFEGAFGAADLGRGSTASVAPCTAEQIFALCIQLEGDPEQSAAGQAFAQNTGLALSRFIIEEEEI